MTEHKYTDEEVIKALECCTTSADCEECPYYAHPVCNVARSKDALDLINRQRAEIADLTDENKGLKETNDHLSGEYIALMKEKDNLIRTYAECQAEAIKEFAEKLQTKIDIDLCSAVDCAEYVSDDLPKIIKNLVKEMTESKPCTEGADCSTCENCYHDGGYNECATDGVK